MSIAKKKRRRLAYFSIIVLAFDSITRTISILSWSFLYSISFFSSSLVCRGVKRLVVLLLLCRISRTLSFLICLMMTCTRTQGIRIQADDVYIHKRVYRRHCHLCRCCMYTYILCLCLYVCHVSLFFFFLQWGVETWCAKFTFTLIIITCSFHIYTINVIYLTRIFFSLSLSFSLVEWINTISMIIADYNNYHITTNIKRKRAACIIELIATHAFVLSLSVSRTLPPAVRMHP